MLLHTLAYFLFENNKVRVLAVVARMTPIFSLGARVTPKTRNSSRRPASSLIALESERIELVKLWSIPPPIASFVLRHSKIGR